MHRSRAVSSAVKLAKPKLTSRCCIRTGYAGDTVCDAPKAPDAPFDICETHAVDAFQYARDRIELHKFSTELHIDAIALYTAQNRPRGVGDDLMMGWGAVVYYVECGGAIKIGTTTRIGARLREQYPPEARVLALEPGHFGVEAARLAQFEKFRAGRREWHYPALELLAFIEQVAKTGLRVEYPIEPRLVEALRDQGELPEPVYGPGMKLGLPRPQVLPPSHPVPSYG